VCNDIYAGGVTLPKRDEIVGFLDGYLRVREWKDDSHNGLQVAGDETVTKVAFAVDACMEAFRRAADSGADMLIVHHGLFWSPFRPVSGILRERLLFLLSNSISLYAAHIPLDAHPEVGNNAQLMKLLGAEIREKFGVYHGVPIGYGGRLQDPMSAEDLAVMIGGELDSDVRTLMFGPQEVERVAVVSGGGAFATAEAVEKGYHVFVTGEVAHEAYHIAKEGGLNVIFAGHYATETTGLKALMNVVAERFDVDVEFIDVPTGL